MAAQRQQFGSITLLQLRTQDGDFLPRQNDGPNHKRARRAAPARDAGARSGRRMEQSLSGAVESLFLGAAHLTSLSFIKP